MKITELFNIIKDNDEPWPVGIDGESLHDLVKHILRSRVTLDLENDIIDLYENAGCVTEYLIYEIPEIDLYLTAIFNIGEVDEYIKDNLQANGGVPVLDERDPIHMHVNVGFSWIILSALVISGLNLLFMVGSHVC